jgi:cold-inducible RNA-binding protein
MIGLYYICSPLIQKMALSMNKLFVASLSWNTDDKSLAQHFSQIGPVKEAIIIKDRETKKSRGFGFVTFENDQDAQRAIQELDNSTLDGKIIKVSMAKERAF